VELKGAGFVWREATQQVLDSIGFNVLRAMGTRHPSRVADDRWDNKYQKY
jgi:hypothetical protein